MLRPRSLACGRSSEPIPEPVALEFPEPFSGEQRVAVAPRAHDLGLGSCRVGVRPSRGRPGVRLCGERHESIFFPVDGVVIVPDGDGAPDALARPEALSTRTRAAGSLISFAAEADVEPERSVTRAGAGGPGSRRCPPGSRTQTPAR